MFKKYLLIICLLSTTAVKASLLRSALKNALTVESFLSRQGKNKAKLQPALALAGTCLGIISLGSLGAYKKSKKPHSPNK